MKRVRTDRKITRTVADLIIATKNHTEALLSAKEIGKIEAGMTDAETIQILLDLLNPLHSSLDIQVTEQFTDERELDPPKDREYAVNVTWQNERDLTQAVMILENKKAGLAAIASVLLEWSDAKRRIEVLVAIAEDYEKQAQKERLL